jgi:hypothetical protein
MKLCEAREAHDGTLIAVMVLPDPSLAHPILGAWRIGNTLPP